MKVCYIESCYQCRYCCFDTEYSYKNEGSCWYNRYSIKDVENVNVIPEWCPLEDKRYEL